MDVRQTQPDSQQPRPSSQQTCFEAAAVSLAVCGVPLALMQYCRSDEQDRMKPQAAAPLRMPQLALSVAGRVAGFGHRRAGTAFPKRPNPFGLAPIGGLAPSPFGSPRQEVEGPQICSFFCLNRILFVSASPRNCTPGAQTIRIAPSLSQKSSIDTPQLPVSYSEDEDVA
jgi:hypothetical protein